MKIGIEYSKHFRWLIIMKELISFSVWIKPLGLHIIIKFKDNPVYNFINTNTSKYGAWNSTAF
jgi:hypothetical protein